MTFHSYMMTRDGQWMAIDLYYSGLRPQQSEAIEHLQQMFGGRCDFTKAAIKWHDENFVSLHSVRIDGFGGFEK